MRLGTCPACGGELYLDYKANRPGGPYPKCIKCSRYYQKGAHRGDPRTRRHKESRC